MLEAKILMIDDDLEDQWIVREALGSLKRPGVAAYVDNGEEAIGLLDAEFANGYIPSLIVLDLNMPLMNGTATLKRLKEDSRFNTIPVIIYSTSINPFEREKCMQLGAHSYITKPISIEESLSTVGTFLSFCGV